MESEGVALLTYNRRHSQLIDQARRGSVLNRMAQIGRNVLTPISALCRPPDIEQAKAVTARDQAQRAVCWRNLIEVYHDINCPRQRHAVFQMPEGKVLMPRP
jgi:hypothetical protein